jgi:MFS family permease
VTEASTSGRYRDALRVAEFRAIAAASLVSILGDSAAYLAVTVLVYERTGSALLSALTFAVAFIPYLFGGTLLSGLVDRIAPRRLLIGCDLFAAVLVAAIALPAMPVPLTFGALFAIGTLAPVRSGTAGAIVAEILPGDAFVPGRSVLRIISQGAQIAGAGTGGALLAPLGPHGALLADTASFLISAALMAAAVRPRPATGSSRQPSLVADSLAGLRDVWAQPGIPRLLLLGWIVPFIAVAPEGLAAPAVAQSGHPPALIGLWLTAIPVGTVLGDLLTVWTIPPQTRQRLTWPLAIALPSLLITFATDPPLPVQLTLLVLSGVASAYGLGLDQTLRDSTRPELLARMYTLNGTGLMVTQGLGFAAAGALGDAVPATTAIAAAGITGVITVVLLLARPIR